MFHTSTHPHKNVDQMCEHEQQTKFFESAHNYFLVVAAASAVLPIQILRLSGEVNTILISLSTGQHLTHKTELNDKLQENVSINWERMVRSKTRGFMRLYLRSLYFVLVVIFIDLSFMSWNCFNQSVIHHVEFVLCVSVYLYNF